MFASDSTAFVAERNYQNFTRNYDTSVIGEYCCFWEGIYSWRKVLYDNYEKQQPLNWPVEELHVLLFVTLKKKFWILLHNFISTSCFQWVRWYMKQFAPVSWMPSKYNLANKTSWSAVKSPGQIAGNSSNLPFWSPCLCHQ